MFLRRNTTTAAAIIAITPTATPTPIPAFAPELKDDVWFGTGLLVAVDDTRDVVVSVDEGLVVGALDNVDVGMKSTIVIVCCLSNSGAGASKVSLKAVEHSVSALQQAQELLLELYVTSVRYTPSIQS